MAEIKFNDIIDSSFEIENKMYPLVALEVNLSTTPNGFKCIEINWEHLGAPKFKVNFDKYIYGTAEKEFDMENVAVRLGLQKLKKLNAATLKKDSLDPVIMVKLLKGIKVNAKVKQGNKYPELDSNDKELFSAYEAPQTPVAPVSFDMTGEEDPFNL